MLLELADEVDADEERKYLAAPDSCIPGSDGEVSDDESPQDLLCSLADQADDSERPMKKAKHSKPGSTPPCPAQSLRSFSKQVLRTG